MRINNREDFMKKLIVCLLVVVMALTPMALIGCKSNDDSNSQVENPQGESQPVDYHLFDRYPDYYIKGKLNLNGEYFDLEEYLDTYLPMIQANQYRDYSQVDFNYEYHTELADQGLFWSYFDETGLHTAAARDHAAVDQLIAKGAIDPAKPTIVFIHGIQMDSFDRDIYATEAAIAATDVLSPDDPAYADYVINEGTAAEVVNINAIYYKNGYNVLNFAYNRFSDEGAIKDYLRDAEGNIVLKANGSPAVVTYAANRTIESKVWCTDGVAKIRYRLHNGLFSDGTDINGEAQEGAVVYDDPRYAIDFTVSEYFCGEWIRCLNYLNSKGVDLGAQNIRFAGHSMGCEVTTSATFLLTELARLGQISKSYLPERVTMLDGYMGFYPGEKFDPTSTSASALTVQMTCTFNCHVNWTGKVIERGGISSMMVAAVRQIVNNDIAYEYYIDGTPTSFVSTIGTDMRTLLFSMVAVVKYNGSFGFGTHNAVRSIYCSGQLFDVPNVIDESGTVVGKAVSSASTDAEVKAAYGKIFVMAEGAATGSAADDVYYLESQTAAGQYHRDPSVVVPLEPLEDEDEDEDW